MLSFFHQVEMMCNYHIGETVLSLQKATLIPGGSESLVYTTLSGGIGMLVPFTSREVCITRTFPVIRSYHSAYRFLGASRFTFGLSSLFVLTYLRASHLLNKNCLNSRYSRTFLLYRQFSRSGWRVRSSFS